MPVLCDGALIVIFDVIIGGSAPLAHHTSERLGHCCTMLILLAVIQRLSAPSQMGVYVEHNSDIDLM